MTQLIRAPARKARDPCSNPGPGENFSLKFLIKLSDFKRKSEPEPEDLEVRGLNPGSGSIFPLEI